MSVAPVYRESNVWNAASNTVNGVQYVDINDPEPYTNLDTLTGGTESIITYADYVSAPGDHTHWNDYYNITYKGE